MYFQSNVESICQLENIIIIQKHEHTWRTFYDETFHWIDVLYFVFIFNITKSTYH